MREQFRSSVAALSRRTPPFWRKGSILKLMGLGLERKDLVPASVDTVSCIEGIEIHTTCNQDVMFRELFLHGFYQDDVLVALRNLLVPGGVFWDIGANYGFMSIYVDRVFDGAVKSVSFEPNPVVLGELEENIRRNRCKSVQIEQTCLSNEQGTARFYTSKDHSWNATLIGDFAAVHDEDIEIEVATETLDACVERLPPPTAMKIDVEGAEHLVIEGGKHFLARTHVPIIAEYNVLSIEHASLTPSGYLDLYRDLGYEVWALSVPRFGMYRWSSLHREDQPENLPHLCNIILLPPGYQT